MKAESASFTLFTRRKIILVIEFCDFQLFDHTDLCLQNGHSSVGGCTHNSWHVESIIYVKQEIHCLCVKFPQMYFCLFMRFVETRVCVLLLL